MCSLYTQPVCAQNTQILPNYKPTTCNDVGITSTQIYIYVTHHLSQEISTLPTKQYPGIFAVLCISKNRVHKKQPAGVLVVRTWFEWSPNQILIAGCRLILHALFHTNASLWCGRAPPTFLQ